jgi:hypothetical protein
MARNGMKPRLAAAGDIPALSRVVDQGARMRGAGGAKR